jgi:ribosomal protein S18 acetylase RimI-like enzyme
MPLPILKVTNVVTPQTLLRYFFQTERQWSGHVAEETNLDFGVAFTNPVLSRVRIANRIFDVALPDAVTPQEIFEQVGSHFAKLGTRCHEWLTNISAAAEQTQSMIDWLKAHGFREHREDILYLERLALQDFAVPIGLQVLPARASYRHALEFAAQTIVRADPEEARQTVEGSMMHLDDPHYEALLAFKDGVPVAKVGVLTVGEIGRIQPLRVADAFQRQGVGRVMMGRAIEICARSLFKHVFLTCLPDNIPAQALYRSLGFTKIGQMVSYLSPA